MYCFNVLTLWKDFYFSLFCEILKIKTMKKGIVYSKEKFEGFTHRFIVRFSVDEDWRNDTNMDIYSNSDSHKELEDFLALKKTAKVTSCVIVHRVSKEQDEMNSKIVDEWLKGGV